MFYFVCNGRNKSSLPETNDQYFFGAPLPHPPPPALRLSHTFDVIVYIICFIPLNYLVDFRICRSTHSAVKIRTKMNFVTYMYTFLSAHFRQKKQTKKQTNKQKKQHIKLEGKKSSLVLNRILKHKQR